MTPVLRAALLTAFLSAPQVACGGAGDAVATGPEVPWPASTKGFDGALVEALERDRDDVLARPADGAAWMALGMTYEAHSMVEYARGCYERAAELLPGDARCWYRVAVVRSRDGDVEGTLAAYARVHALAPDYMPAHRRRGHFLIGVGEPEDAAAAFEAALALVPGDVPSQLGLAEVDLERNLPEEALRRLDAMNGVPRASAGMRARLRGLALSRLGRHDEAEPELARGRGARSAGADPWTREVSRHKIGPSAILLRAGRMIDGGQPAAALELLQGLDDQIPDDPRLHTKKGRAQALLGRWAESAESLTRASDLDAEDVGLALAALSAMLETGDTDGALRMAGRVIAIDVENPRGHALRADLLLAAGRLDELDAAVVAARAAGVRSADLEVTAGKAALERGDRDGARAAFEGAIELDPGNADAWVGAALLEIETGSGDDAAAALARVRELAPDHPMRPTLETAYAERTAQGSAGGGGR